VPPKHPDNSLRSLYIAYSDELAAFARRRVDSHTASDVVHDTFLRVATYGDVASLENPRAYLYRVAANVANDSNLRISRQADLVDPDADAGLAASPAPGPEQCAEHQSTLERCLAALAELPEACRNVFLLHRVDGIPQAEIADLLGLSRRTVERHVARALAHCLEFTR
jgi:RNA polymerase sigma-70 factor (ECF subfamily)